MNVEILIAWADRTWTTEVHDVPQEIAGPEDADAGVIQWAQAHLTGDKYKTVVLFVPFMYDCEDEGEPVEGWASYEAARASYEAARASLGEAYPPKSDFTCNVCRIIRGCPWAWDLYNTNGDCLATK